MHAELRLPPRQLLAHRFAAAGTVTRQNGHRHWSTPKHAERRPGSILSQAACRRSSGSSASRFRSASQAATSLAHRFMGRPHRHAAANEVFHEGRRVEKALFEPGGDPVAPQFGPLDKFGGQLQTSGKRVAGLEQRRLVFLQVAVVGQGQIFDAKTAPAMRAPTTRADLPRMSSSTSGLRFCGMIDEPVVNASGSLRKPNSVENQKIHSCAQPLRWMAMSERQKRNSTRKSRSCETSRLLAAGPENPSSRPSTPDRWGATCRRGRPLPSGEKFEPLEAVGDAAAVALEVSRNRPANNGRPSPAGPVADAYSRATTTSRSRSLRATNARCRFSSKSVDVLGRGTNEEFEVGRHLVIAAAGRVQLAADVAGPGDQRLSTCMWMSSSSMRNGKVPASISRPISSSVVRICRHSASVIRPHWASICAWAFEPRMSTDGQTAIEADRLGEPLDAGIGGLLKSTAPGFGCQLECPDWNDAHELQIMVSIYFRRCA